MTKLDRQLASDIFFLNWLPISCLGGTEGRVATCVVVLFKQRIAGFAITLNYHLAEE
jgi:hypothetical protein